MTADQGPIAKPGTPPAIEINQAWDALVRGEHKAALEALLPEILLGRRWFGGKGRSIQSAVIQDAVPVVHDGETSFLALTHVEYDDAAPEVYILALSHADGQSAARLLQEEKSPVLLRVRTGSGQGVIYDAVRDRGFVLALLEMLDHHAESSGASAQIEALQTGKFAAIRGTAPSTPEPRVMNAEQSNSSIVFGSDLILKLFRRMEKGINPDFEIGQFLTEHGYFHSPPVAGALELRAADGEPSTIALLQGFVPNQGDAWKHTLQLLHSTLAGVADNFRSFQGLPLPPPSPYAQTPQPPFALIEVSQGYFDSVRLLAQRTAELHLTLDSSHDDPSFAPEPPSRRYQQAVYRGMRTLATAVLSQLRHHRERLGPAEQEIATRLLSRETDLLNFFEPITGPDFDAERIRIHGDYHLGQVLFTGEDFVIIDFEGEPLRSLKERRIKRSPLRDVAGMVRSFDYAGEAALMQFARPLDAEQSKSLHAFVEAWVAWVSAVFVGRYMEVAGAAPFLPSDPQKTAALLSAFCLDKAIYELGYEINNRPTWVRIPLKGIAGILEHRPPQSRRQAA